MRLSRAIVAACAFGLTASAAHAQSVTLLGPQTTANGVSADGRTVVGDLQTLGLPKAFVWTAQGGRYDYGLDPGMPSESHAYAVSGDGTTIAGWGTGGAYRWRGPGTFQTIGGFPFPYNGVRPTGVSHDGSIIVGHAGSIFTGPQVAAYWTASGGMRAIPTGGSATADGISRDGSTVVGNTHFSFGLAYTWTSAGGVSFLQSPPDSPYPETEAAAINVDGTIVVGRSAGGHPTIWRNEVPSLISLPTDWVNGFVPTCVNDNGSVVGGFGGIRTDGIDEAAIWTPGRGPQPFTSYIASFGLSFPAGYYPESISGVSADGTTFVGRCFSVGVARQGFVVTIPSPGVGCVFAAAITISFRRRQRSIT